MELSRLLPLLAELGTELPRDSRPGEFCYVPGRRNCARLSARNRYRPKADPDRRATMELKYLPAWDVYTSETILLTDRR